MHELLVFDRRDVAEFLVQAVVVVEADPLERLVLEVLEAEQAAGDEFGLVSAYLITTNRRQELRTE